MEKTSPLGYGWLGDMYHAKKQHGEYRVYDTRSLSLSLLADIKLREQFSQVVQHPQLPIVQKIDTHTFATPYQSSSCVLQLIQEGGIRDEQLLIYFLTETNSLLSIVHAKGWVHGDLHPGVMYVAHSGEIIIEGFGRPLGAGQHPHTGHHRYLSPEPSSSIESDIYALGVIALELALGEHVVLGDILEASHTQKLQHYLSRLEDKNSVVGRFIHTALQFSPEQRKNAPMLLLPFLGQMPSTEWMFMCSHLSLDTAFSSAEQTDPLDVVFQTDEEERSVFFPSLEEITMNELTEDFLPMAPLQPNTSMSPQQLTVPATSTSNNKLIIGLGILVIILIIVAVVM